MWFFRLIRWPNLLILAFLQFFTGCFLRHAQAADTESIFWQQLICIILSTILIAAAGNIINDIQDIEIDKINKPEKLIVEIFISRKNALKLYGLLSFSGLLISSFVSFPYFICSLIAAQLLWLYSVILKCKGILGNLAIAFLMGLSVWVVQFSFAIFIKELLLFYTVFAFFTGFIREIIKDVEDKNGDEICGCRTFAVKNAIKKVKKSIFLLLLICILLLLGIGFILWQNQQRYLVLYQIVIMIPAFLFFGLQVQKANETKQFSNLSLYIKLIMLAGILSMPLANIYK